jgi:hypothetical protein
MVQRNARLPVANLNSEGACSVLSDKPIGIIPAALFYASTLSTPTENNGDSAFDMFLQCLRLFMRKSIPLWTSSVISSETKLGLFEVGVYAEYPGFSTADIGAIEYISSLEALQVNYRVNLPRLKSVCFLAQYSAASPFSSTLSFTMHLSSSQR